MRIQLLIKAILFEIVSSNLNLYNLFQYVFYLIENYIINWSTLQKNVCFFCILFNRYPEEFSK